MESGEFVVGFGVLFRDGAFPECLQEIIETALNDDMSAELKIIPSEGGFIVGSDYLTEGDCFPAIYLERSKAAIWESLRSVLNPMGIEVTNENFVVIMHKIHHPDDSPSATCTTSTPSTPSPQFDVERGQLP